MTTATELEYAREKRDQAAESLNYWENMVYTLEAKERLAAAPQVQPPDPAAPERKAE